MELHRLIGKSQQIVIERPKSALPPGPPVPTPAAVPSKIKSVLAKAIPFATPPEPPKIKPAEAPVVERPVVAERTVRTTATDLPRPRERFRLLPSAGRKGGERVDGAERVERPEPVEEIDKAERT